MFDVVLLKKPMTDNLRAQQRALFIPELFNPLAKANSP